MLFHSRRVFDMNLIERYLSEMSRKTGISVSLVDKIPEDISPYVYRLLQSRAAAGWYVAGKDRVCLLLPTKKMVLFG